MKPGLKIIIAMVVIPLIIVGCTSKKEAADLIITNAVIYTVDENFSVYDGMVLREGEILAVGSADDLLKKYQAREVLDAGGKFVYPGFYDPHCHFYHYGAGLVTRADLTGTSSLEEVLDRMQQFAETRKEGWLAGRGWDQNNWLVKEFPDNSTLNKLYPDRPVILIRIDGHAVLVNDVALELAGIDGKSRMAGGEVMLQNGKPTGILLDNAADIIKDLFLKETIQGAEGEEELIRGILQGQQNCFAVGLTMVADAGLEFKEVQLLEKLQEEGRLKMKVYAMLNYTPENIGHYMIRGPYRTKRMHVHSVKFYADGALGSRGALLLESYTDKPGYHGILTVDPDKYKLQCTEAFDYGYQVNTHAIGDSAVRMVLDIYGQILQGRKDHRWRIEHAQVVHPDDLKRFAEYSVIPAINTTHAISDMDWAQDRLGPDRVKQAYAYKTLLQTNGWLCNGSDFPVEQINPLLGFYAAVARKDLSGKPEGGWQSENALSRREALMAMTIWAAKSCFEDKQKGSLKPGKAADFVMLDQDIMTIPIHKVPETNVTGTWINGEKVF